MKGVHKIGVQQNTGPVLGGGECVTLVQYRKERSAEQWFSVREKGVHTYSLLVQCRREESSEHWFSVVEKGVRKTNSV